MNTNTTNSIILVALLRTLLLPLGVNAETLSPASLALAQPALAKEISSSNQSALPSNYLSQIVTSPNYTYFVASDNEQIWEVWRTDGTGPKTLRVPRITAKKGTPDSIQIAGTIGDRALITAEEWKWVTIGRTGQYELVARNLWLTDGTENGTQIIRGDLGAQNMITLHNKAYFIDTGTSGLWQLDSDTANTTLAVAFGGSTQGYLVSHDWLYYIGPNGLWRTDGTQAKTQFLASLDVTLTQQTLTTKPASDVLSPSLTAKFALIGNTVYVRFDTILLKSDLTTGHTELVSDQVGHDTRDNQSPLLVLGEKLFFTAVDTTASFELWSSDGTATGTGLFKDVAPGGNQSKPYLFTVANNRLFFRADDHVHGMELWSSDGTLTGTHLISDIVPFGDANPDSLTIFNNRIYFVADDPLFGRQIWSSDGSASGTQRITDIGVGTAIPATPDHLTAFGPHLLFTAASPTEGRELWISDGNSNSVSTHVLVDINTNNTDSNPAILANVLGKTFIIANEVTRGRSLWVSDGSFEGTQFLLDLTDTSYIPADVGLIGVIGNKAYFFNHGDTDFIWSTDGTITNTKLITAMSGNSTNYSYPSAVFNNQVFITAGNRALYRIDPAQNDALTLIKQFTGVVNYDGLVASSSGLWIFVYEDSTSPLGLQLWHVASDNSIAPIQTLGVVSDAPYPTTIASWHDADYFVQRTLSNKVALWKSNGTETGTSVVSILTDTLGLAAPTNVITTNQFVYVATSYGIRSQLWQSNGTFTGTRLITTTPSSIKSSTAIVALTATSNAVVLAIKKDDNQNQASQYSLWRISDDNNIEPLISQEFHGIDSWQSVNGIVSFLADGNQLWRTDGTPAGTKRIYTFPTNDIQFIQSINDSLLISVRDSAWSLWLINEDNASQITKRLTEVQPCGPFAYQTPLPPQTTGQILFCGNTNDYGNELWHLSLDDSPNIGLQLPVLIPTTQSHVAALPIAIVSESLTRSITATLTATLPVSVTYITDTLGISPSVNGNTLIWQIPDIPFGQREFIMYLQIPTTTLGTRYPIAFSLRTPITDIVPNDNHATSELWLTTPFFLPVILR